MKLWNKFLTGFLVVATMTGCNKQSESLDGVLPEDDGEPVYMSVKLKLPTASPGTRSKTGETTTEDGQDYENTVRSVLLVLACKDQDYIAHSTSGKIVAGSDNTFSVTSAIGKTALGNFYLQHGDDGGQSLRNGEDKIYLYAYCNPPQDLLDSLADESKRENWRNISCVVGEKQAVVRQDEKEDGAVDGKNQSIWAGNSFLMTNAEPYETRLPLNYNEWEQYATQTHPYEFKQGEDVIAIPVERSVARFDFKDGSPTETDANTYVIESTGASNGQLQVQLLRMSLVNMSNSFYYLKRVTTDNNVTSKPIYCGGETVDNYVMDTDWDKPHKNVGEGVKMDVESLTKYYCFPLFNDEGGIDETTRKNWNNHPIETVLAPSTELKNGYHIWRYVTENTIPGVEHQRSGVSTGIVFKGKITALGQGDKAVNSDLWQALNGIYKIPKVDDKPIGYVQKLTYKNENGESVTQEFPILYSFDDVLYVGWNHQVKAAVSDKAEGTPLWAAFYKQHEDYDQKTTNDLHQEVVRLYNDNKENTEEFTKALQKFRAAATSVGFTLYQASVDEAMTAHEKGYGPGYYCYYYYWNRHNDNGRPGTMGPMEFAVVRNNVYKLSVTKINYLGHPRRTDNDPEPLKPENPDEDAKIYLQVSVKVRPWTVRVNDIEF